jgi:DNA-binding XRE family transcriptional regulator
LCLVATDVAGITDRRLREIEAGTGNPTWHVADSIARALGWSLAESTTDIAAAATQALAVAALRVGFGLLASARSRTSAATSSELIAKLATDQFSP